MKNRSASSTPAASQPLIALRQLGKHYPNGGELVRALDGINLEIHRGEFIAIMGQSGSGKSTLMHILGCLDRPSTGEYVLDGQSIGECSAEQLAVIRRHVFGFVFQRYNLLTTESALENVAVPALYAGMGRGERQQRAARLLKRLGLEQRLNHKPAQLSGGQQQRVSIARALINGAEVILADEPTGALDSRSGQEVLALLKELHAEGTTVILITHDAQVAAHAHRQIVLADGRMVSDVVSVPAAAEPVSAEKTATDEPPISRGPRWPRLAAFGEAVHMALRSLRANLLRTALTLLGVVIGVASVVALLALGEGSKQQVLSSIEAQGTNLLLVFPGSNAGRARDGGDVVSLKRGDVAAIAALDGVEDAVGERRSSGNLRYGSKDYRAEITGVDAGFAAVREWQMARGSFFDRDDVERYASVIVLGQTVVDNLFLPGDDPLGQYLLVDNALFQVVGILKPKGANSWGNDMDNVALIPVTTGSIRLYGGDHLSTITIKVASSGLVPAAEEAVTKLLEQRHLGQEFRVRNTASLLEMVSTTQNTLALLLGSVAAISLVVGGIGVMNIMLVSVTERTREIGVRMATGARQVDILLQFNIEAIVVCCIGGLLGVATGIGVALIFASFGQSVIFTLTPSLMAFGCAVATGVLFGYLPARKAARLDPVIALAAE